MDNLIALTLGIVASLIATFLFIGISELSRRVLIPKFRDLVYSGVRLDGRWELNTTVTAMQKEAIATLELNQKGDQVTGLYRHKDLETQGMSEYDFKGEIKDMYLVASISPKSKQQVDSAALMFMVKPTSGGLLLQGGMIMRSDPYMKYQGDLEFNLRT
ncbi:hypothetical protein [Vibrio sp. 10N.261.55.A7]|uniref:hypothetical protein n=1 Tax=Vibrio sp. 10N.261.55.A7 TaxID=1880851 RepID=UPI000C853023|nr:hypothetical protein [Vibrio sp. 10N.261.55.A7]PMJ97868.1 hypothetical protein BCU12_22000 [Vibrio sp. 10N.261.55.A7]